MSRQPCAHRWYQLVRPCHPANNLQNCPEKLQLAGWETRQESCPWCDAGDVKVHESTHRLFGSTSSASSTTSSPTSPYLGGNRPGRSGSDGAVTPLSRHSSTTSIESQRAQKHREMNERLEVYLSSHHHEVLPSAKKNYPVRAQTLPEAGTPLDRPALKRTSTALSNRWRRSVRVSVDMFRS